MADLRVHDPDLGVHDRPILAFTMVRNAHAARERAASSRLSFAAMPFERRVVVGWRIARDGRKHTTGTALYGADGTLRGASGQLWIEPRKPEAEAM